MKLGSAGSQAETLPVFFSSFSILEKKEKKRSVGAGDHHPTVKKKGWWFWKNRGLGGGLCVFVLLLVVCINCNMNLGVDCLFQTTNYVTIMSPLAVRTQSPRSLESANGQAIWMNALHCP